MTTVTIMIIIVIMRWNYMIKLGVIISLNYGHWSFWPWSMTCVTSVPLSPSSSYFYSFTEHFRWNICTEVTCGWSWAVNKQLSWGIKTPDMSVVCVCVRTCVCRFSFWRSTGSDEAQEDPDVSDRGHPILIFSTHCQEDRTVPPLS